MTGYHSYEPAAGHRLAHDPLNAIIAPRPIGWISTVSDAGVRNLAPPYSFFNLFNYSPSDHRLRQHRLERHCRQCQVDR